VGAPETGEEVQTTGSWLTLQPGLPTSLTGFLEVISGLLDVLIVVLNVVLAILQVVKAFLVGLLDPITAIIEAILAEIEGLIRDIRQIGLYIAGDWGLLNAPTYDKILGVSRPMRGA